MLDLCDPSEPCDPLELRELCDPCEPCEPEDTAHLGGHSSFGSQHCHPPEGQHTVFKGLHTGFAAASQATDMELPALEMLAALLDRLLEEEHGQVSMKRKSVSSTPLPGLAMIVIV